MKYTRRQYNAIIADAEQTIKRIERVQDSTSRSDIKSSFICSRTACSFCPVNSCIGYQTATEWRDWLERFQIENDPDHPYTVEIPASFKGVIDEACHIDSSVSYPVFALLRLIQKQINDENRD